MKIERKTIAPLAVRRSYIRGQLPVIANNRVVGMLSREDIITYLLTIRELRA